MNGTNVAKNGDYRFLYFNFTSIRNVLIDWSERYRMRTGNVMKKPNETQNNSMPISKLKSPGIFQPLST